jgi:hypothetical protein
MSDEASVDHAETCIQNESETMDQLSQKVRARLPLVLAITGGALLLLLGSPLILVIVDSLLRLRWDRLTEIGQSYTGVAALLSGAALIGIAYSIRLQTQQIAITRSQAVREMQFSILRLAMEDPSLSMIWLPDAEADPAEYRRRLFRTQMIRYLEFAYISGEISESRLRGTLVNEVFVSSGTRTQWAVARSLWLPDQPGMQANRRFLKIMDESCAEAEESADSSPGTE